MTKKEFFSLPVGSLVSCRMRHLPESLVLVVDKVRGPNKIRGVLVLVATPGGPRTELETIWWSSLFDFGEFRLIDLPEAETADLVQGSARFGKIDSQPEVVR